MTPPTAPPVARLHVADDLGEGASVELGAERAHYLRHVLRLEVGAGVRLFNGRDGEWATRIAAHAKRATTLTVGRRLREQSPEPDLWLVFAALKRTPMDLIAQKATELGVSALLPVMTRRTVASRVAAARLAAIAVEAAEQSERLTLPVVEAAMPLSRRLAAWPAGRRLLLCAEAGSALPIATALEALRGQGAAGWPWGVLIGPEGGFDPGELDEIGKVSFVTPVGLGPRLLRAETAALAALACWQAILGDGAVRPPLRP